QQQPQSRQWPQAPTVAPLRLYQGPSRSFAFRLFDHLVGAPDERVGDAESERLRSLEIDGEFDLRYLLHRKLGDFFAFEYPPHVDAHWTNRVRLVRAVRHEPPGKDELARRIYRCHGMASRQGDHHFTLCQKEIFTADYKCAYLFADKGLERRFEFAGTAGI